MRILTVYAHPDDEAFGPAAVLARYAREGAEVHGLCATRGEHGQPLPSMQPPPSPAEMGRLREEDLRAATRLIGYRDVALLAYEDGTLEAVPPVVLEAHVLDALRAFQPQVVLTFGPGGITRHPDHLAIHRATTAAFHRARAEGLPVRALFYDAVPPERAAEMGLLDVPDGQPNTWIAVAETMPVKLEALRLHARHVLDAADMAERLASLPPEQTARATFHRAWPEVPEGVTMAGLLDGEHDRSGEGCPRHRPGSPARPGVTQRDGSRVHPGWLTGCW